MAVTVGSDAYSAVNIEASYGVNPAGTFGRYNFISSSIKPTGDEEGGDPALGGRAPRSPIIKLKRGVGDQVFGLQYEKYLNHWWSFFGAVREDADPDTQAECHDWYFYPHTKLGEEVDDGTPTTDVRSFSHFVNADDLTDDGYMFLGAYITSLGFSITNNVLQATMGWLSSEGQVETTRPTVALQTVGNYIIGGDMNTGEGLTTVKIGEYGTAGAALSGVSSIDISMDAPLTEDREHLGDLSMQEPGFAGDMTVGITVNAEHGTSAYDILKDWNSNKLQELQLVFTGPTVSGGSTSTNQFELYFPKCVINDAFPDISDNGINTMALSLNAYWDDDNASRGNDALETAGFGVPCNMWLRERVDDNLTKPPHTFS